MAASDRDEKLEIKMSVEEEAWGKIDGAVQEMYETEKNFIKYIEAMSKFFNSSVTY